MMKISTLCTVIGITLVTTQITEVKAQESPWKFGAKAGVNVANTSSKDESGRVGFNVGGTVEYQLNNRFFLQSGLEFTTKGSKIDKNFKNYPLYTTMYGPATSDDYTKFTGKVKASQNLMYLQMPLTIGYRLPVSNDVNLTFNAGGYMAYRLTARMPYDRKGILTHPDGTTEAFDLKTTYKGNRATGLERLDYGLLGGIGIEYQKFSFNINYELGLRNLEKTGQYITNGYGEGYDYQPPVTHKVPKWKNRNISFSVGYKF